MSSVFLLNFMQWFCSYKQSHLRLMMSTVGASVIDGARAVIRYKTIGRENLLLFHWAAKHACLCARKQKPFCLWFAFTSGCSFSESHCALLLSDRCDHMLVNRDQGQVLSREWALWTAIWSSTTLVQDLTIALVLLAVKVLSVVIFNIFKKKRSSCSISLALRFVFLSLTLEQWFSTCGPQITFQWWHPNKTQIIQNRNMHFI